jgi:hypothetical protein
MGYFLETVEDEGLWYAVDSYSDFEEIKDPDFHQRRQAFLDAGRELMRYAEEKRGQEEAARKEEGSEKEGSEA